MVAELTALRDQIDDVDKALLNLLAKRTELVAEVGEVKSRFGLPIYVPERGLYAGFATGGSRSDRCPARSH